MRDARATKDARARTDMRARDARFYLLALFYWRYFIGAILLALIGAIWRYFIGAIIIVENSAT